MANVVVEDHEYTSLVNINHNNDNTYIYRRCSFQDIAIDSAIKISGTSKVIIEKCNFNNIGANGIWVAPSNTSRKIIITGNTFRNIGGNGINTNTKSKDMEILDNDMDTIGTFILHPEALHGLYIQAPGSLIRGNTIRNIIRRDGNGISIRASGIIENNTVYNCTKNGITYYSDHDNSGDDLVIRDNYCYDIEDSAVGIISNGERSNLIKRVSISNNTLCTRNTSVISIAGERNINQVSFLITNNTLYREDRWDVLYNPYHAPVVFESNTYTRPPTL